MTKMKLELPEGDIYEAKGNLDVTHETDNQFFINGLEEGLAAFEAYFEDFNGQDGRGDSLKQSLFLGAGAGIHTITVGFSSWEGESRQWGPAASDASALDKLQVLNRDLTTQKITSDSPALLSINKYSSSGDYDPIPVVVLQSTLRFDSRDQVSDFDGDIVFAESSDVSKTIDALANPES